MSAVCFDCAKAKWYKPKDKVVGVWMDECHICHKRKLCTSSHEWKRKEKGSAE